MKKIASHLRKHFPPEILHSLLTFALCLLASGIRGRALWCDEILRINGQSLSISQLLAFEHLKTFCTQTTAAYLFMRPWQILLGMETGGFLLSALSGSIVTLSTLVALRTILDTKRIHPIAALLVATNPLVVYYGSELAFYSMWSAAGAVAFTQLIRRVASIQPDSRACAKQTIGLVAAATALVAFHFAGIFVWAVMAGVALIAIWQATSFKKTLAHSVLFAIPVILNLPMYIGSMRAPEHIGTQTLKVDLLSTLPAALFHYWRTLFPSLTGGWWVGSLLVLIGTISLIRGNARNPRLLAVILASVFAITPFLAYSYLRGYMPVIARYWVPASAPTLLLVALGAQTLATHRRPKHATLAGWAPLLVVLSANSLVCAALITVGGRPHAYKALIRMLDHLPPERTVVCPNHYETRFLGGYYPLPKEGQMTAPCLWEHGRDARIQGLRHIWRLQPDAIAYIPNAEGAAEVAEAGIAIPGDGTLQKWPRLLDLAFRLRIHPEPVAKNPMPPQLVWKNADTLARQAEGRNQPLVIPGAGWRMVYFLTGDGRAIVYALLAGANPGQTPKNTCQINIHIPAALAETQTWTLKLVTLAYQRTSIDLSFADPGPPFQTLRLPPPSKPEFTFLPQRKTYPGLPRPDYLLANGSAFAVSTSPAATTVTLPALHAGWNTLTLRFPATAPWMLLHYTLSPESPPLSQ